MIEFKFRLHVHAVFLMLALMIVCFDYCVTSAHANCSSGYSTKFYEAVSEYSVLGRPNFFSMFVEVFLLRIFQVVKKIV